MEAKAWELQQLTWQIASLLLAKKTLEDSGGSAREIAGMRRIIAFYARRRKELSK